LIYAVRIGHGAEHERAIALATLILGYQILVLVERAPSAEKAARLFPSSIRFWSVWGAAALSLPILMYLPATAALMSIAPLGFVEWLGAAGVAAIAVGWRLVTARPREAP